MTTKKPVQEPVPNYDLQALKEQTEFQIIAKPWKTWLNFKYFPKDHEENFLPSATVPDQSLTVKQILERHTRGISPTSPYHPVYNGDMEYPDLTRLDRVEIEQLKQANRERIQGHLDEAKRLSDEQNLKFQKEMEELKKTKPNVPSDNKPV